MHSSKTFVKQIWHDICICGLNSAFDQNEFRCHFGQIESIAFLGIVLQINIGPQPTTCLYTAAFDEVHDWENEQQYLEFDDQKFQIKQCIQSEQHLDTSFHTLRVSSTELRALVDHVLAYFLDNNHSFAGIAKDSSPYKVNWSDFGLQAQSYNDDYDDWHAYRGLKLALPFNSRGTCRRAEEMLNGKCFTDAHYQYFAGIVPLLNQLNAPATMN